MMNDEKFSYFMERTKEDLDHIRTRVDKLWDFRLMILGGSAVVSILFSSAFHLFITYLGGH